jgi:hypothetical protein
MNRPFSPSCSSGRRHCALPSRPPSRSVSKPARTNSSGSKTTRPRSLTVPFNDFELTLPQGKYSALAANLPAKANYNLCKQKMVMPAEFVAQNGAVIQQITPIATTGCPKAETSKKAKKSRGGRVSRARRAGR